ncbi:hypothetical protein AG1IA_08053 [Rhizoctonia solani AG-1 IA]|uniref:Uncharacterized protein n=1 Tax=Thanatephorus cucumeris (strain AG1-IA) TaxID=983506 RepID=L8WJ23_THACA|nr:hypothetical protein AG1IA_08053 [Rhizoctonia solani AG-1 IA]
MGSAVFSLRGGGLVIWSCDQFMTGGLGLARGLGYVSALSMVHVALVSWPKALDPSSSATLYLYSLTVILLKTASNYWSKLLWFGTAPDIYPDMDRSPCVTWPSSKSSVKDAVYPRRGSPVRSAHGHTSFLGYNPQQGLQLSLGIQGAGCTRVR